MTEGEYITVKIMRKKKILYVLYVEDPEDRSKGGTLRIEGDNTIVGVLKYSPKSGQLAGMQRWDIIYLDKQFEDYPPVVTMFRSTATLGKGEFYFV